MGVVLKVFLGIVGAVALCVGSTFAVIHFKKSNFRKQFPDSFSRQEIEEMVTLENYIKEIIKKDKSEKKKKDLAFIIADVIMSLKKKEEEGRDLSKAIERLKKLAADSGIEIEGAMEIFDKYDEMRRSDLISFFV